MSLAGQTPRRDQIGRGIALMVAASLMFSFTNAAVKWEVDLYPIGEVAFVRTWFGFLTLCIMILPRTGFAVFRTHRPFAHVKRAGSQFASMICMMTALSLMPLADATAIGFTAPLFTALLSIVVLKDRVGIHRWSALIVGFLGVLLMTRPGHDGFQIGAAFALLNAVMISTVAIAIRRMSLTESSETLTLCQMALITLFTIALLPFGWVTPAWADVGLLAIAGVGNGIAQFWWTKALHIAPPSAVVPFQYLSLVWTGAIGYVVWHHVPTSWVIAGAMIVVASGLYILWRETVRRAPTAPRPDDPT